MPSVYYCRFLGDGWSEWKGGYRLPPIPDGFDEDTSTFSLASRDGQDICYVYDPEKEKITWCNWEGNAWATWQGIAELPPPPNYIIEEEEAYLSTATHEDSDWVIAYNPADGSVYWSEWTGRGYSEWKGGLYLEEDPPNFDEHTDIFAAGEGLQQWLIAVNLEDWSVFYTRQEGDHYGEWKEAPKLPIPEEWVAMGVDLDGNGREGRFSIYATVYNDE